MRLLRVAAHVHSTWSYDGLWTLHDLARAFATRGYDAVLMSEHDRTFDAARWRDYRDACGAASGAGALLVPGIEYSDADNLVHVPVWGAEAFLGAARPTRELLEDAVSADAVAVIAHPRRREAWRSIDPEWLDLAHGVEVWNRKCDGWAPSDVGVELAGGGRLRPFVGLDFHSARQFFPLAMVAPAEAVVADVDGVLRALRDGRFAPTAFRSPVRRFSTGSGLRTVRAGEHLRRPLARAYRRAARIAPTRR